MDYSSIILLTDTQNLEIERGGGVFSFQVRIQNGSNIDLLSSQNIFVTYHILDLYGNMLSWDNERTEIALMSGEEGNINVSGTMLDEAGEFLVEIDIVKEGVEWYSANGLNVIRIPVKVLKKGSKYKDILEEEIKKQQEKEKFFSDILLSGGYSIDEPFIQINPYGNSPLTAIVIFQTEEPMRIFLRVAGKTKEADINGSFLEYTTEHAIPVYGLYADFLNTIKIIGETIDGRQKEKILEIKTEPIEGDFNAINLSVYIGNTAKYESGVNFCYTGLESKGMKMAYDINGDIRWYLTEIYSESTSYSKSTSIWVINQSLKIGNDMFEGIIYEYSLLGRIMSAMSIPYWVHHEIYLSERNTIYIAINSEDTVYDALIEVDLKTGEILHYYNYKKMFMRTRNTNELYTNRDWLHMNAVVEHKGDIIVSGNAQSTIMKHDKNGNIKWIFADPIGYTTYWRNLILTPIGDNFEYCYNQHAIEILPNMDGNTDTFDMLLFDNGDSRNKCKGLDKKDYPPYSRVVHYRIDEKNMTVEQIWEYGKERKELYSMWRGDANYLRNGNILGVFNIRDKNDIDGKLYMESCVCVEVDREKNIIWESYGCSDKDRNSYQNYRMERKKMYDEDEKNLDFSHEVNIVEIRRN